MIGRAEVGYEVMGKQNRGGVGWVEDKTVMVMYASRSAWAVGGREGRRATPPGVVGVRKERRGQGGDKGE